jgi:hypothetical protein
MAAILLADLVWEGTSAEMLEVMPGLRDGHFYKQLDTGESYFRRAGIWEYVNLGLAFIKATKSGRVITSASGDAEIVFNTPFIDDQYSISMSVIDPGGPPAHTVYFYDRATTGFKIKTRLFSGAPAGNIETSWLCTRDYDP